MSPPAPRASIAIDDGSGTVVKVNTPFSTLPNSVSWVVVLSSPLITGVKIISVVSVSV